MSSSSHMTGERLLQPKPFPLPELPVLLLPWLPPLPLLPNPDPWLNDWMQVPINPPFAPVPADPLPKESDPALPKLPKLPKLVPEATLPVVADPSLLHSEGTS